MDFHLTIKFLIVYFNLRIKLLIVYLQFDYHRNSLKWYHFIFKLMLDQKFLIHQILNKTHCWIQTIIF